MLLRSLCSCVFCVIYVFMFFTLFVLLRSLCSCALCALVFSTFFMRLHFLSSLCPCALAFSVLSMLLYFHLLLRSGLLLWFQTLFLLALELHAPISSCALSPLLLCIACSKHKNSQVQVHHWIVCKNPSNFTFLFYIYLFFLNIKMFSREKLCAWLCFQLRFYLQFFL